MKLMFSALAVLLAGALNCQADDKAIQDELKKLEGTWLSVKMESNGQTAPSSAKSIRLEFKSNKLIGFGRDMNFEIDPSRSPKQIDFIGKIAGEEFKIPAIYELRGDELTLCIPLVGKGKPADLKRPRELDSQSGPALRIQLKRTK